MVAYREEEKDMTTVGRQNAYEEILSLRTTWQDRLVIEEAERQDGASGF